MSWTGRVGINKGSVDEPDIVNEPDIATSSVTLIEFRVASDPESISFFQLGIYNNLLWLVTTMCVAHFLNFKRPIISLINIIE